ncbi:MAG: methyltransferase domain-containing protein [Symploca sp. SIO2B6]|nr:methyltransferase domain-containing protein [Symploca sp. SIO2B6]
MTSDIYSNKQKLFDRWAPHYDCLLTTVFYQAVHKRLLEYVELSPQPKVLDIGCGTGRLLHRLTIKFPTLEGIGLDLSTEMISQAQQSNQHADSITYRQGNAETLPFIDEQFDAVFNTISFLHYPNPQKVLSEVSRVLRPNGRFYLADHTVPEAINTGYLPFFAGGLRLYSFKQREQLGMAAGLECLGHYYLLCPVMLTVFTKLVL